MNHPSILTVGSLAFDSVETPAGKVDRVLGGSVNYFSIAASFFSAVDVVAVVGDDFPKDHLSWLNSRKISTQGVQIAPGKTFHWAGAYDQNSNEAKTLTTALNVFEHFAPKLSLEQKKSKLVFLGNIDPVLQLDVLNQVEGPGWVGCDSMNFWIAGKKSDLLKTLGRIDFLSINEGEAYLLSGTKNLKAAADVIRGMGPQVLAIKRGEYGASLFTPHGTFLAPAFPVDRVIDPTGAGDSFAGAMMGFLAEQGFHRDLIQTNPEKSETLLRRAVLAGSVMASFTVEDFSFQRLKRLTTEELVGRQNELLQMTRV